MERRGCSVSLDGMVLLTIALAALKACGKIGCSWVWVFAPLWVPAVIALFVFLLWVWANSTRRW